MKPKLPKVIFLASFLFLLVGISLPFLFPVPKRPDPFDGAQGKLASVVLAANSGDVVINEIAWMGTKASSYDEWIEVYNNTDSEIDLSEWTLSATDGTPNITLDGTVSGGGFFLLERTDDTTVNNIIADQIYTGALSNDGENLELRDADGNLIDAVDASEGWFAGDNTLKTTMERIDPKASGSAKLNWANNNGETINGKDADSDPILGTPKAQNSVYGLDTTPPEDVTNLQAVAGNTEVTLSWTASVSADVSGYKLYFDSKVQDLGDVASYTVTGLTNETTYTFKITAYDASSNESSGVTVEATPTDGISAGDLLINEIAFREDNDWVELVVIKVADYEEYRIFEGGTLIATIPAWGTLSAGDYIVLHEEAGTNDLQKSDNNSGYWDIYGMGGLVATDNSSTIKKPTAEIRIDGVIWSNNDGKFTKSKTEAAALVADGQWDAGSDFETSDEGAWVDSDDVKEGESLARDASSADTNSRTDWQRTTTQTPGAENKITEDGGDGEDNEVFEGEISEIKDLELGTKVKVQGFVTAPPGIFGDDIFYIRDDSAGIKVSNDDLSDHDLQLGDEVELSCTIEESRDERYIKLDDDSSLVVVRSDLSGPGPVEVETGAINEGLEGQLVKLSGEIVETSGGTFWIDDGSGRAKIYVKDSTGIEVPDKSVGDKAEVVGIVSQWGELKDGSPNYRVMPRFQSDLEITESGGGLSSEALAKEDVLGEATGLPITSSPQNLLALLGGVYLCLGLAVRLVVISTRSKSCLQASLRLQFGTIYCS